MITAVDLLFAGSGVGVLVMVAGIAIGIMSMEMFGEALILGYQYYIEGDKAAGEQIMAYGLMTVAATVLTAGVGGAVGAFIGKKLTKDLLKLGLSDDLAKWFIKNLSTREVNLLKRQLGRGVSKEYMEHLVAIAGRDVLKYSDEFFDEIGKLSLSSMNKATNCLKLYGDNFAEVFIRYGDDAIHFVSQYGDDALGLITKYGDDVISVFNKGFNPSAVKTLADYNIIPSQYTAQGISYSTVAENVARMLSSSESYVDLYRAVGAEELTDILETGIFQGPGGASLVEKQFGFSADEVLILADWFPDSVAIVKARIPKNVFALLDFTPLDTAILKSGSTTVRESVIDLFNSSLISIEQII